MGYCPVPATSTTICRYAAYLAKTLKLSSVKQYLNIVRLFHEEWNLPNPLVKNFNLTCTLRGIRRHLGDNVVQKKPITPDLLHKILSQLNMNSSLDAAVWAACLAMFYGLLRRSNVLITEGQQFSPSRNLRRRDVLFFPWGVMLHIRWSKVIQYNSKTFDIPLPRIHNNDLCPVQAIFHSFELCKNASLEGPAFMYAVCGQVKPLTSTLFIKIVRECLSLCHVDPVLIGTHSFRRGGASFCYGIGLSPDAIKLLGDWKSNCYQRYLENDVKTRFEIVRLMQKNI